METKTSAAKPQTGDRPVSVPIDAAPLVIAHREAFLGIATDLKPVRSRPAVGGGEWVAKTDDDGTVTLSKSSQIKGVDRARADYHALRARYATAKSKSDNARKWADETKAMARLEKPKATLATAAEREKNAQALESATRALKGELDTLVEAHPVVQHDIAVTEHAHAQNRTAAVKKQIEAAQAKVDRWKEYEAGLADAVDDDGGPKRLDDVQVVQRDSCAEALEAVTGRLAEAEAAEADAKAKADAVKVKTTDSVTIVVRAGEPFLVV